jgi:flagellar biosynthesis GTPase FlhF
MEELLPRIREELGPDAVITRRREGVTGGVGGFFAKRCVEIEARPPSVILPPPSVPRRAVIDVYDTPFEPVTFDTALEEIALEEIAFAEPVTEIMSPAVALPPVVDNVVPLPAPVETVPHPAPVARAPAAALALAEPIDHAALVARTNHITLAAPVQDLVVAEPVDSGAHEAIRVDEPEPQLSENALLEILLAQTSPFADELAEAVGRGDPIEEEYEIEAELEDDAAGYEDSVISLLLAGGITPAMAHMIIADAERELAPFEPDTPLRALARRTLAQRLTVRHGTRSKRRTIALVGPPGAGKTLTAAKLCNVYAMTGRSVAAVSLEPARQAMRLVMFTDMVDVNLEIADAPKLIQHARERTADASVVIADTPAIVPGKRASFAKVARLLEALEPDETHLLLPADWSFGDGRALIDAASAALSINRLLITHADKPAPIGVAVGLSLATKLPVSYVSESSLSTGGIRPAEPRELARMIL